MNLVVIDLDAIPPDWARDLETLQPFYRGVLNGEILRQLGSLADQRQRSRDEKFAAFLYGEAS